MDKPEISTHEIRDYLTKIQGQEITLKKIRSELGVEKHTKSFDAVRNIMFQLADQKIVRPLKRGAYKVIKQVSPVPVYSIKRERRPPLDLIFPKDRNTEMEMDFAKDIVIREGDLILISGMSNFGKTTLCLNFSGENIDRHPVLMGNEYTSIDKEPTPRFMSRLDSMDWVKWVDDKGNDKFLLLPVWEDYAEHIIKDRINIIDWINLPGEYYMISPVMEAIKHELGRGIAIIALQKNEGNPAGRGGAPTKDFADCELLIDRFGKYDCLLTVGKVKEYTASVIGKTYAYGIVNNGVNIINFREVEKCHNCHGMGYKMGKECELCNGKKYIDK